MPKGEAIPRWSPLLEGALHQRATGAILAITDALCADDAPHSLRSPIDGDSASLAAGAAGVAVFFAYVARSGLATHAAERAERLLNGAQAILAAADTTPSLYGGFTGVAWATEHLNTRIFDSADDDPNQAIDEALQGYLAHSPWHDDFDLVSGLVGIGVYALERLPRPGARTLLELVIDRLRESAERTPEGITWHTANSTNGALDAARARTFESGADDCTATR